MNLIIVNYLIMMLEIKRRESRIKILKINLKNNLNIIEYWATIILSWSMI